MDTQVMLSIIIPMYNPGLSDLRRCFKSISSIRHPMEVILIDDGSEDKRVKEFCESYIGKDARFRYYYQKNRGVSGARNLGLTKAKGRYVTFVDADDAIDSTAINNLELGAIKAAQLVLFDIHEINPAGSIKRRELFPQDTGFVSKEKVIRYLLTTSKLYESCGKLFCMDIIRNRRITFPKGISQGEDVIFNCRYIQYIEKIYYCKEVLYQYHYTMNNTTKRFIKNPLDRLNDVLANYKCLRSLIETSVEKQEQGKFIKILDDDYICGFGSRLMLLSKYKLVNRDIREFICKEVKPLLLKDVRNTFRKKPKACIFDLLIRNNLWFAFSILQHFKRAET